jgi:hypothetical protein
MLLVNKLVLHWDLISLPTSLEAVIGSLFIPFHARYGVVLYAPVKASRPRELVSAIDDNALLP